MIELRVLGTLDLRSADGRALHTVLAQPKRLALLAYLAVATPRGFHRRDTLLALFWPDADQERARAALRQAVHGLRQRLGDGVIVNRGDDEVAIERTALWCDAAAVDDALDARQLTEAVELYRGDLLTGFFLSDVPEFERWLEDERVRLRDRVTRATLLCAEREMAGGSDGSDPTVLDMARRARNLAPDDESTTRHVIELMHRAGDRAGALRTYDEFARRLASEYQVTPSADTKALIERVRSDVVEPQPLTRHDVAPASPIHVAWAPSVVTPTPAGHERLRRLANRVTDRPVLLALTLAVVLAVGIGTVQGWPRLRSALGLVAGVAASTTPTWILVADFEGPSSDRTLGLAVRELVSATIEQLPPLATVPRDQLQAARRAALMPDTALFTGERARYLAYRAATQTLAAGRPDRLIRAVVEGRVDRLGDGNYGIVVRAVAVEDGEVLAVANGSATDSTIIRIVESLARRMAARLAERSGTTSARRPNLEAITPSFDAYRKWVEAFEYGSQLEFPRAIALLREAVTVDPDFATAWGSLGANYRQLGFVDSARFSYEEALRHPQRLTPYERLRIEAILAEDRGDAAGAIRMYDRLIQEKPSDPGLHTLRGLTMRSLGRYNEEAESFRRALTASLLDPAPMYGFNLARTQIGLDELDSARALTERLPAHLKRVVALDLALAEGDWPSAARLASAQEMDAAANGARRAHAATVLASAEAARGRVASAREALRRATTQHSRPPGPSALRELLLDLASGHRPHAPLRILPADTGSTSVIVTGIWHALNGDMSKAMEELREMRARPIPASAPLQRNVALLEASIAANAGRWKDLVGLIAAPAWRGEPGAIAGGLVFSRWLVADAFEQAGMPDSAANYFELLVSPTPAPWWELQAKGLTYSFAHRRLAHLYTQLGRVPEAQRHWQAFLHSFTEPDPEFRSMVAEAQRALGQLAAKRVRDKQ